MKVATRVVVLALALGVAACGQRQVEVRTAPTTNTDQAVQVNNTLSQAVNIYITPQGGSELFLKQVPANTIDRVAVQGVAAGTTVVFKAVTIDGSRTYQSRNVVMSGLFVWPVP